MPNQAVVISYLDPLKDNKIKQLTISEIADKLHFTYNPVGVLVADPRDIVNFYFHYLLVRKLLYCCDNSEHPNSMVKIFPIETIRNMEQDFLKKICIVNQGSDLGFSVQAIETIPKGTLMLYTGELLFSTKSQLNHIYNKKDQTYFMNYLEGKLPLDKEVFKEYIKKLQNAGIKTDGLEFCLQDMQTDEMGDDVIEVKYLVDAKQAGTFARFIQFAPTHVDGFDVQGDTVATANLETVPEIYALLQNENDEQKFIPGCLLRTTRDIKPGEMLGLDYSGNDPARVLNYFLKASNHPPMLFNRVGEPLVHLQLTYIKYLVTQTNKIAQLPFSHNELYNYWQQKTAQSIHSIDGVSISPSSYTPFNDSLQKKQSVATCEPPPGSQVVDGKTIVRCTL